MQQGFARRAYDRISGREAIVPPELAAYRRLAASGYRPAGIVDVGAYHGDWTRLAQSVFPGTPALMVEAQRTKIAVLEGVRADLPCVRLETALLGRASGQHRTFYEMETGSSMLPEQSNVVRGEHVLETRTLDEVAPAVPGPLFLKLDVQGAELEVLDGGAETLARSDVVQLEVALLAYNAGAPTMLEVMSYMDARGFVPFDMAGFIRPTGVELAQVDIIFVQRDAWLRPTQFIF